MQNLLTSCTFLGGTHYCDVFLGIMGVTLAHAKAGTLGSLPWRRDTATELENNLLLPLFLPLYGRVPPKRPYIFFQLY